MLRQQVGEGLTQNLQPGYPKVHNYGRYGSRTNVWACLLGPDMYAEILRHQPLFDHLMDSERKTPTILGLVFDASGITHTAAVARTG